MKKKKYYDYSDVLILPKRSHINSRKDVLITRKFSFKYSPQTLESVPIIISNMDTTGTIETARAAWPNWIGVCLHKFYTAEQIIEAFDAKHLSSHFVSVGISDDDLEKIRKLKEHTPDLKICIDVANGYIDALFEFIRKVRKAVPTAVIMAGNICTPDVIIDYADAGADIVKVGVGCGGQCYTRKVAGVGVPQLTAVMDCVQEADRLGLLICADGGVNEIADFGKALGAGADFVMAGSIFAGHNESGGNEIYDAKTGRVMKEVYGMSSNTAMLKYGRKEVHRTSEGRSSLIELRGPIQKTFDEIIGGIRSTMSYTDSLNIEDLANNVTFISVQNTINRQYEKDTIGN